MTNLTFQCLLFLTASHQLLSVTLCGDGWVQYESNCYLFLHKEMDFLNALYQCRASGGGLLEINDEAEDQWLYFHFKIRGYQRGVWLGVVDAYNDRVFRTISTQKEPTYVKWHAREPNNYGNRENCTMVWVPSNSWFDADCVRQYEVVCKR